LNIQIYLDVCAVVFDDECDSNLLCHRRSPPGLAIYNNWLFEILTSELPYL
jgi:hypothetical protein